MANEFVEEDVRGLTQSREIQFWRDELEPNERVKCRRGIDLREPVRVEAVARIAEWPIVYVLHRERDPGLWAYFRVGGMKCGSNMGDALEQFY